MEEVEEEEEEEVGEVGEVEEEEGVVGMVRGFDVSGRSKYETHSYVLSWRDVEGWEAGVEEVCCVRDQVRGG